MRVSCSLSYNALPCNNWLIYKRWWILLYDTPVIADGIIIPAVDREPGHRELKVGHGKTCLQILSAYFVILKDDFP